MPCDTNLLGNIYSAVFELIHVPNWNQIVVDDSKSALAEKPLPLKLETDPDGIVKQSKGFELGG